MIIISEEALNREEKINQVLKHIKDEVFNVYFNGELNCIVFDFPSGFISKMSTFSCIHVFKNKLLICNSSYIFATNIEYARTIIKENEDIFEENYINLELNRLIKKMIEKYFFNRINNDINTIINSIDLNYKY